MNAGTVSPSAAYYIINSTPLYFVRSGDIFILEGRLRYPGIIGCSWETLASSKHYGGMVISSARYLEFKAEVIIPSSGPFHRFFGFSLCRLTKQQRG